MPSIFCGLPNRLIMDIIKIAEDERRDAEQREEALAYHCERTDTLRVAVSRDLLSFAPYLEHNPADDVYDLEDAEELDLDWADFSYQEQENAMDMENDEGESGWDRLGKVCVFSQWDWENICKDIRQAGIDRDMEDAFDWGWESE